MTATGETLRDRHIDRLDRVLVGRSTRRRRLRIGLLVLALVAVVGGGGTAGWRWWGPVTFDTGTLGGGVTDLGAGDSLMRGGRAVTPFREGMRVRIPMLIMTGASGVTITDVRIEAGDAGGVRAAGAVTAPGCCVVRDEDGAVPLRSARADRDGVMVGVDLVLCCRGDMGHGSAIEVSEVVVSYRHHGVPYTTHAALTRSQRLEITF